MKAGLPEREPELLKRWQQLRLYDRMREEAMGREKFILHDGPPYANGNIHIGTGLNKILKDVINRSQRMMGKDANYVPGWDCHGLPDRVEDRGGELSRQGQDQARPLRPRGDDRVPPRMPRLRAALARRAARGVQAAWASRATGTIPTPP